MNFHQNKRIEIERKTVQVMIQIFCSENHKEKNLCRYCNELSVYAIKKLDQCIYGNSKPSCKVCPVHCFSKDKSEEIKQVMRYAGPKMIFRQPVLTFKHIIVEKLHKINKI